MGSKSNRPPWLSPGEVWPKVSRVAMLLGRNFEEKEAESPKKALEDAGFSVDIVSPDEDNGACVCLKQACPEDYDGLVLSGGSSPDDLKNEEGAVDFVKSFVKQKKPIAALDSVNQEIVALFSMAKSDRLERFSTPIEPPSIES